MQDTEQEEQQQLRYETLHCPPKFIAVGKLGKYKFYEAKRDIKPIAALADEVVLKNLSLIISALFIEKPAMKTVMSKGEEKREPDWNSINGLVRYFGFVDLDMELSMVMRGQEPMITGEEAQVFANKDKFKLYWSYWIKEHSNLTIGEIRKVCKPFDSVCNEAQKLCACLEEKQLPYVLLYSGLKGWRILFHDPKMFYWCFWHEEYSKAFQKQKAAQYYTELGMDPAFGATRLDVSVYDNNKGVKPDVLAHPDSALYSFLVKDYKELDSYELCRRQPDPELIEKVKWYWTSLPKICPLKLEHLRPKYTQQQNKINFNREEIDVELEEKKQPQKRKHTEIEVGQQAELTEEMQQGIAKWMKSKNKEFCIDPFPSYRMAKIKQDENVWRLHVSGWQWCDRNVEIKEGKPQKVLKKHSSERDVYFIVNEHEVFQKCFSSNCASTAIPVYSSELLKEKQQRDRQVANAVIRDNLKRMRQQEQEAERREYNRRSPSPDSRPSSEKPFVVPAIQHVPVDRARFRQFSTREKCKAYYIKQFEQALVYPLIIQSHQQEVNFHRVPMTKIKPYMEPKFEQHVLYVVIWSPNTQESCTWGFSTRESLKQDGLDYLLLRKKCYDGLTPWQAVQLHLKLKLLPPEVSRGVDRDNKFTLIIEPETLELKLEPENQEHVQIVKQRIQHNMKQSPFYLTDNWFVKSIDGYYEIRDSVLIEAEEEMDTSE